MNKAFFEQWWRVDLTPMVLATPDDESMISTVLMKLIFNLLLLIPGLGSTFPAHGADVGEEQKPAFGQAFDDSLGVSSFSSEPCTYNGIHLHGKVKVVEEFPDIEVEVVTAFPDLKVKTVTAFADKCGEWRFVDSFPDFTVKFVDAFADVKIQYVDAFPGQP